jgi:hypothetical protein
MRTKDCREKIDIAARACNLAEITKNQVKRAIGISDQLEGVFCEISQLTTDTVLELGKKANKDVLEKVIPELKRRIENGDRPTKQEVKRILRDANHEIKLSPPPKDDNKGIYHADFFKEYKNNHQQGSIDCIITDPPYPGEWLENWSKLSEAAEYLLKPSGFLISYSGHIHLPKVMQSLGERLNYYWISALVHSGSCQLVTPKNVKAGWKPILIYQKSPVKKLDVIFNDVIIGTGREKESHEWQQAEDELKSIIEAFTAPNETILDPFMGSGTTLIAAKKHNRRCIGYEIADDHYGVAFSRLNTPLEGVNA